MEKVSGVRELLPAGAAAGRRQKAVRGRRDLPIIAPGACASENTGSNHSRVTASEQSCCCFAVAGRARAASIQYIVLMRPTHDAIVQDPSEEDWFLFLPTHYYVHTTVQAIEVPGPACAGLRIQGQQPWALRSESQHGTCECTCK